MEHHGSGTAEGRRQKGALPAVGRLPAHPLRLLGSKGIERDRPDPGDRDRPDGGRAGGSDASAGDPPTGGGCRRRGKTGEVLSARSINIPEAKAKLQQKLGREIFTGHQEVVVFGERMARTGIREALDYMARQPQVRLDAVVFVSDSPKEIFTTIPLVEITASESLYKLARVEGYTEITVMRVLREVTGDAKSTVIPVVKKTGKKSLSLDGMAVFRGERMVDHLDRKSKEGLMWIRNEYTTGTVNTRIKGEKGYVAMKVDRTKTELIPKLKGKKPHMTIRMTSENVLTYNGTDMDLYFP